MTTTERVSAEDALEDFQDGIAHLCSLVLVLERNESDRTPNIVAAMKLAIDKIEKSGAVLSGKVGRQ